MTAIALAARRAHAVIGTPGEVVILGSDTRSAVKTLPAVVTRACLELNLAFFSFETILALAIGPSFRIVPVGGVFGTFETTRTSVFAHESLANAFAFVTAPSKLAQALRFLGQHSRFGSRFGIVIPDAKTAVGTVIVVEAAPVVIIDGTLKSQLAVGSGAIGGTGTRVSCLRALWGFAFASVITLEGCGLALEFGACFELNFAGQSLVTPHALAVKVGRTKTAAGEHGRSFVLVATAASVLTLQRTDVFAVAIGSGSSLGALAVVTRVGVDADSSVLAFVAVYGTYVSDT